MDFMSQCQTCVGSRRAVYHSQLVRQVFLYFKYSQTIILRSKNSQLRLNGKAMLFIENQFANKLNFHWTTRQFSDVMARKI